MLLWVLGLLLSIAGLCVWLEFACMIPRSGGEKVYLEAAYRRPKRLITTVFAVQAIALGFTGKSNRIVASMTRADLALLSIGMYSVCVQYNGGSRACCNRMATAWHRHWGDCLHYTRPHILSKDWRSRHELLHHSQGRAAALHCRDRLGCARGRRIQCQRSACKLSKCV